MATNPNPTTKYTEQAIQNLSFDTTYNVLAVELLAEDVAGTAVRRLQTDTSGYLKVNVAAGSASDVQFIDGAARGTATGTLMMVDDGTNIQSASGDTAGRLNVNVNGTVPVSGTVATTIADGSSTTLGAKADAKSAATDTTAVSAMSVLKQISASVQAPPSQAVTQATGTNLHTVVDSGTITTVSAVTAISSALPAGTNAIGGITGAGSNAQIKDDSFYGDGITSGLLTTHARLWNGTNYDRASGDTTGANVHISPRTTGGLTVSHTVSTASTNATVVKNSAGQLYGWFIYNSNAAARKVAFHNASATPTAGASIFFTLVIPPTSGANVEFGNGIPFSTGISITTVTGLADSDTTAVAANDLIINLFYK